MFRRVRQHAQFRREAIQRTHTHTHPHTHTHISALPQVMFRSHVSRILSPSKRTMMFCLAPRVCDAAGSYQDRRSESNLKICLATYPPKAVSEMWLRRVSKFSFTWYLPRLHTFVHSVSGMNTFHFRSMCEFTDYTA